MLVVGGNPARVVQARVSVGGSFLDLSILHLKFYETAASKASGCTHPWVPYTVLPSANPGEVYDIYLDEYSRKIFPARHIYC